MTVSSRVPAAALSGPSLSQGPTWMRLVAWHPGSMPWEREAIGERTSAALAYKRTQGQFTGGRTPYGYRVASDGDTLEPDPAEQAIIAAAREAAPVA